VIDRGAESLPPSRPEADLVRVADLAESLAAQASLPEGRSNWLTWILAGSLGLAYLVSARLALTTNVNWDEFHYLSYVYEAARGSLEYRWATFHVHFFGWLRDLGSNEVDQVVAARLALQGLALLTGWSIFRVARRFVGREAALVAVLCYASFSFVVRHGISFRPDPICAFLLVAAVDLALPPRRPWLAAVAGVAMAVSVQFSLKTSFQVGVLVAALGVVFLGSPRSRAASRARLTWFSAAFAAAFVSVFAFHQQYIHDVVGLGSHDSLWGSVKRVFGTGLLLPQRSVFLDSVGENAAIWLALVVGVGLNLGRLVMQTRLAGGRAFVMLLFASPLLAIVVYRNAFPYFYVFMLPLATISCGEAAEALLTRGRRGQMTLWRCAVATLAVTTFSGALAYFANHLADQTLAQRQLLQVVHRLFPQPVPYIDRCSMVSSFPKVGFFMSTWGMQRYREARRPVLRDLLLEHPVAFLVANSPTLTFGFSADRPLRGPYSLLPEDLEALRQNFLPHWGLILVQGKRFDFGSGTAARRFEILSAGRYTVESDGEISIDSVTRRAGEVVSLSSGWHEVAALDGVTYAQLRWGEHLPVPAFAPIRQPLFTAL